MRLLWSVCVALWLCNNRYCGNSTNTETTEPYFCVSLNTYKLMSVMLFVVWMSVGSKPGLKIERKPEEIQKPNEYKIKPKRKLTVDSFRCFNSQFWQISGIHWSVEPCIPVALCRFYFINFFKYRSQIYLSSVEVLEQAIWNRKPHSDLIFVSFQYLFQILTK